MYRAGEVVTLLVDKSEGAGEGSLHIQSGITGMIANAGRACREGDYSYVVDFGPEGQWNCTHNELDSLNVHDHNDEEEGWDEDEDSRIEQAQDITEEQASAIYGDESRRPGADGELRLTTDPPPLQAYTGDLVDNTLIKKKEHKIISFEEDLARVAAEAERNGG
jgi:hypothetical protein